MVRLLGGVFVLLALGGSVACSGSEADREAGQRARGSDAPASKPAGGEEKGTGSKEPNSGNPTTQGDPGEAPTNGSTGSTEASAEEKAQDTGQGSNASEPVLEEKWYVDSDGNVVPDFIEVEEGYDPKRDDCAPEKCGGAAAGESVEFLAKERNAMLILDSSGSMAAGDDSPSGRTKMEAAKESLLKYSGVSAAVFETGFMVFGHEGDNSAAGKRESCSKAAETLLPMGEVRPESFEGVLDRFRPTGWTPIEGALEEAGRAFAGREDQVNRVVLVTDGIETCGGDPVAAAERLNDSGIELQVDVVGFGVPTDQAGQLRDIALAGGGEYFDARTGADLDSYLSRLSDEYSETADAAFCARFGTLGAINCDATLCSRGQVRIGTKYQGAALDAKIEAQNDGNEALAAEKDAEFEAMQRIMDRISEEREDRQKIYEKGYERADELRREAERVKRAIDRAEEQAYGDGT